MQRKRGSKIIALLLVSVMFFQSFGGVTAFASGSGSKEGDAQIPTVYSSEQKEASVKEEATSGTDPKPTTKEEKPSTGTDTPTPKPETSVKPTGEAKEENPKPAGATPVGEASGEVSKPPAVEGTKPEGEVAKTEGETATAEPQVETTTPPATEQPKPAASPLGVVTAAGDEAGEYKVSIDDPYVKEIAEATEAQKEVYKTVLGMSNIEEYTMFTVTYEAENVEDSDTTEESTDPEAEVADGDAEILSDSSDDDGIITVKDGDMVPAGTKLTIVAKPIIGPMTVTVNEEQHETPLGRLQETTIEYTADGEVNISARSGLMMFGLTLANTENKDGGTARGYSINEQNATISGSGVNRDVTHDICKNPVTTSVNNTQLKAMMEIKSPITSSSLAAFACKTPFANVAAASANTQAADHIWKAWDSFNVAVSDDATIDPAILNGNYNTAAPLAKRDITLSGTGTITLKSGAYEGSIVTINNDNLVLEAGDYNGAIINVGPNTKINCIGAGTVTNANIVIDAANTQTHGAINFGENVAVTHNSGTKELKATSISIVGGAAPLKSVNIASYTATGDVVVKNVAGASTIAKVESTSGNIELENMTGTTTITTITAGGSTGATVKAMPALTSIVTVTTANGTFIFNPVNSVSVGTAGTRMVAIDVPAGTTYNMTTSMTASSGGITFTGAGAITTGSNSITSNGGGNISIAPSITGNGDIITDGVIGTSGNPKPNDQKNSGSITLTGANIAVGNITANSAAGNATQNGYSAGAITINSADTTVTTKAITGGSLTIQGGAKVSTANNPVSVSGAVTITSEELNTGTETITAGGAISVNNTSTAKAKDVTGGSISVASGATLTVTNNITTTTGDANFNGTVTSPVPGAVNIKGTANFNTVNNLTVSGKITGGTVNFKNSRTYTASKGVQSVTNGVNVVGSATKLVVTSPYVVVSKGTGAVNSGTVSGIIDTDAWFGPIITTADASGTIDYLYCKGYGSLSGLAANITYKEVFGGGTTKTETTSTGTALAHPHTGAVDLTINDGNITDKIFGGGDRSSIAVASTISVNITGGNFNALNLYGGSYNANAGDVTFTISGAPIYGSNAFGGGRGDGTAVTTNSTVVNYSAVTTPAKNIYGGGYAESSDSIVTNSSAVTVKSTPAPTGIKDVFGGGLGAVGKADVGSTSVTVGDGTNTTTITGNIYGGGHATAVGTANVDGNIIVSADKSSSDNIYGGGRTTAAGSANAGNISLTVNNSTTKDIHGGGHVALAGAAGSADAGEITLTVGSTAVVSAANIYGGGHTLSTTGTAASTNVDNVTMKVDRATATGDIHGGGHSTGDSSATAKVIILTVGSVGAVSAKNIYGGGHSTKAGVATAPATVGNVNMKVDNVTVAEDIYGGGHATGGSSVKAGEINLKIATVAPITSVRSVYGGGFTTNTGIADVDKVTLKAGTFAVTVGQDLYGGGHTTGAGSASVISTIDLDLDGAYNGNVYGGGFADGAATGDAKATNITLKINSGTVGASVYGGGHTKGTGIVNVGNVTIALGTAVNPLTVTGNVYGGGHSAAAGSATAGEIILTVKNATAVNVYGGGISTTGDTTVKNTQVTTELGTISGSLYGGGTGTLAPVTESTIVKIGSTVNLDVFGGGDGNTVGTTTNVTVTGTVNKDVYGGGNGAAKLATVGQTTTTTLDAGQVNGNVYGGGLGGAAGAGDVLGTTNPASTVKVINAGKVGTTALPTNLYGGGNNAAIKGGTRVEFDGNIGNYVYGTVYGGGTGTNAPIELDSSVLVEAGTVGINLYGGGSDNPVKGKVDIIVKENGTVKGSLYGGGSGTAAPIGKHVTIDVNGKVDGDLYGGGENNPVNNGGSEEFAVYIILREKAVTNTTTGDVYGGAKAAIVNGNVKIDTQSKSKVKGNLYGGGNGDAAKTDSTVKGYTLLNINGSVDRTVYGGGINNAPIDKYTIVNIIAGSTSDIIGEDVYGGGADETSPIKNYDTKIAPHNGVGNSTTTTINGYVLGNVYGGSRKSKIIANTVVYVKGGKVNGSVYGASHDEAGFDTDIDGTTYVEITGGTIDGTGNQGAVFGGGSAGSEVLNKIPTADIAREYAAKVFIKGADVLINSHVYGGGEFADTKTSPVHGPIHVDMQQGMVHGNIYGGGFDSLTEGYTKVEIGPLNASDICTVDGIVFGGGNGPLAIVEHIRGTDVLIRQYATVGSVYGGGENSAHITATKGTGAEGQRGTNVDVYGKVVTSVFGGGLKADVNAPAIDGTFVTIHSVGEVGEDVFGGGNEGHVFSQNTTDVYIYGTVKRNVYGGSFDGNVTEARGPYVTVSRENGADNSGFVGNDVYGGGYGYNKDGQVQQTHVLVEKDSTVQHSVFGGGRGPGQAKLQPGLGKVFNTTDVEVTGQYTVIGKRDKTSTLFIENNPFTRCKDFMFRGETEIDENVVGDSVKAACSTKWMDVGNVYGGGSWAEVGSDTSIKIYDMDQKAFNRVSGGNLGIVSTNAVRNVDITGLGVGVTGARAEGEVIDELNNTKFYSNLDVYTAVRFLQDYSTTNTNTSHLTIYYNLKSTDDGVSVHGIHNTHKSDHIVNDGNYHSWRPKEHTTVIVEPKVTFNDNAKLRIEANYAIDFKDGAFAGNMINVTLLMDPALDADHNFTRQYHDGSTTKIYGPDDVIKCTNVFSYEELLRMLVPTDLQDRNSSGIVGVSFYIPPIEVLSHGVENTNWGGTSKQDLGGTYEIVVNQEELDGMPNALFKIGGDAKAHYTDPKEVASMNALIAKAQAVLKISGKTKALNISEKKAGQVSTNSLIAVAKEAAKTGATMTYRSDTHNDSENVEGRISIDTSKVKTTDQTINTGVHTCAEETAFTAGVFKNFFRNKTAVIALDQEGSFGTVVKIAAKVDLGDLDQENLMFYSFSPEQNKFTLIKQADYSIDTNGYVHFYTDLGGDIVITDSAMKLK